jgi:hypothetical protein
LLRGNPTRGLRFSLNIAVTVKPLSPEANEIRLKLRAEIHKRVYRIGVIFYPNGTIGFAIDFPMFRPRRKIGASREGPR